MRILIIAIISLLICFKSTSQNVGIGTNTPAVSAKLDVTSTTSGLLPPRMTTQQRNAIANPVPGLMIFNTDRQHLEVYTIYGWHIIINSPSLEKLYGGSHYDDAYDIQQTTDGGYIVAGYSTSSASGDVTGTNHGATDFWVVKLDALGNIVWNKLLGGTWNEETYDVQQTTDGGYIVAGYSYSSASGDVTGTNHGPFGSGDYWIVKLNASGNIVWNKLLGGSGHDVAYGIRQTTDGGYIIAGHSNSSNSGDVTGSNHGGVDYWILKLDASGNIVWNKLLGGNVTDVGTDVQQTTDGGYIVAGYSHSSANGDVTGSNHGLEDYWIIKLDGLGNIVWNKLLGGTVAEIPSAIQQTTDGGYIIAGSSSSSTSGDVTGTTNGGDDYWIVKLDGSGSIVWNKLLGGIGIENATAIHQTTGGGYIVAGISNHSSASGDVTGTSHGNNDYWIIKLDGSGLRLVIR